MSQAIENYRNVAFVGHPSSGKTTLVDALAHKLGAAERKGSVAEKTSLCDTEPEEQEKQHTLQLALVHAEKDGHTWNLIDTPGYPDFRADSRAATFASDLTVGVVSCSSGVSFNLGQKLDTAAALGRGRAIIVTHIDGDNADFDQVVADLRARVGDCCAPVLVPNESGGGFSAVRDVLTDEGLADAKKELMDAVMDSCEDEELLMAYMEDESLSPEQLSSQLPSAIAQGSLVPVLACNPETGVGLDEVLAFLAEFGPNPASKAGFTSDQEDLALDPNGPFTGVVFCVRSDPHVGRVCLARVLAGTLSAGDSVVATDGEGKGEKLGGLFHSVGPKKRDAIDSATAGDLVAFTKVDKVGYGDTFVLAGSEGKKVDVLPQPEPMVSMAVFPKSRSDEQKIGEALHKLEVEDPTFHSTHDPLTRELVISGMSDLHLQIMEARLKRRYGVEIETKLPRIAYRETVTKPSEGHHRHKKQSGGRGQFGECFIRMKPGAADSGVTFVDAVVGGSIPRNLIPAVEKGIREMAAGGVLTSSEVVDVEVELYDGKFHAVDSDEASFKKAGGWAFKDAFMKGGPVLLEPVMEVLIEVPTTDAGTVFSDVTSQRRGQVIDQESAGDGSVTRIKAHVPLGTMQTYFRDLKSQTAGEGTYHMSLDHYSAVPAAEQQKIIAEYGIKHEDD